MSEFVDLVIIYGLLPYETDVLPLIELQLIGWVRWSIGSPNKVVWVAFISTISLPPIDTKTSCS